MYRNYPVTLARNTVHANIEVIDAPLDYNIILGHSYTYAMLAITSLVFRKMCFPHEGKIITIDQLNYYELTSVTSLESIISSVSDKQSSTPLTSVSTRVYKYSSLFGAFPRPPPPILEPNCMSVCMLQASLAILKQSGTPDQQPSLQHLDVALPSETYGPTPLGPPPFVSASPMFPLGLNHPGADLPGHYPAGHIPFLFPPSGVLSVPVMALLVLPNMTLGFPVWYINPPTNISPGQVRPYHALNLVQPVPMALVAASVPSQP